MGFRGQELVLPVLPRAQREDVVEDVRRPVKQNLAAERKKVVRLAEVRDPRPVPALEQPVRVAGGPRPVPLYQEHAMTAAREGERRGKTSQPGSEHNNITPAPGHMSDHPLPPGKDKPAASQYLLMSCSSPARSLPATFSGDLHCADRDAPIEAHRSPEDLRGSYADA